MTTARAAFTLWCAALAALLWFLPPWPYSAGAIVPVLAAWGFWRLTAPYSPMHAAAPGVTSPAPGPAVYGSMVLDEEKNWRARRAEWGAGYEFAPQAPAAGSPQWSPVPAAGDPAGPGPWCPPPPPPGLAGPDNCPHCWHLRSLHSLGGCEAETLLDGRYCPCIAVYVVAPAPPEPAGPLDDDQAWADLLAAWNADDERLADTGEIVLAGAAAQVAEMIRAQDADVAAYLAAMKEAL